EKNNNGFVYHIDTLPSGETTEIHFLSGSSMFSKLQGNAKGDNYESLKQREEDMQDRLAHREERLSSIQWYLLGLAFLVLIAAALWWGSRLAKMKETESDESFLEKADPLHAHFLDQRMFFGKALPAGLLS